MRLIAIFILALGAVDCRETGHSLPPDSDLRSSLDSGTDLDFMSSPDVSVGHRDVDRRRDADVAVETLPGWDENLWTQRECAGTDQIAPVTQDAFRIPDRPPGEDPVMTASEFLGDWSGGVSGVAQLSPAAWLQPGAGRVYDLFSPGGRDVRFHYYYYSSRSPQDLQLEQRSLTVLVDYEPVEATWIRWNAQRSERLLETTGSSAHYDSPGQVEIVDFTIPASAFPDSRNYEISFGMYSTSPKRGPQDAAWRMALYNGGYDNSARPCSPPPLGDEWRPIEEAIIYAIGFQVLLFFDGIERFEDVLGQPVVVEGGSTIRFFASVVRARVTERVVVAQPTVNGEPISAPVWVQQGGTEPHRTGWIDERFSFEYVVPDEPGRYDVNVLTWADPYEVYRDLDGNVAEGVLSNSIGTRENSNPIQLVVQ